MTERLKRALVTGVTGQDGILLAEHLVAQGYLVYGFGKEDTSRLALLRTRVPSVEIVFGDIRDQTAVAAVLEAVQPNEVYNLAALSSVARSWQKAREVMDTNALALVGLLEGIRALEGRTGMEVRFYQASSSEMFGSAIESPQTETTPFHPRSPYGVAKCAAHFLTVNYRESYGMYACSGILYNHESWLRPPQFVTRKITMGVAAIARGHRRTLSLGKLDISRDWGYAPDYVRAMWMMLQQDIPDDYIVASGKSHTLREFLTTAFGYVGISDWSELVTHDESLLRPAEVGDLVGDATKARMALGWGPTVDFEEMVTRMVGHDLQLLSS